MISSSLRQREPLSCQPILNFSPYRGQRCITSEHSAPAPYVAFKASSSFLRSERVAVTGSYSCDLGCAWDQQRGQNTWRNNLFVNMIAFCWRRTYIDILTARSKLASTLQTSLTALQNLRQIMVAPLARQRVDLCCFRAKQTNCSRQWRSYKIIFCPVTEFGKPFFLLTWKSESFKAKIPRAYSSSESQMELLHIRRSRFHTRDVTF